MPEELNFLKNLTGSFAMPAAENPTVEMIEAAYRHHDLPWRYINFEVPPEKLGDAVNGARAMGFAGFNCSLPHKVAVIEHLDGLDGGLCDVGCSHAVVGSAGGGGVPLHARVRRFYDGDGSRPVRRAGRSAA